MEEQTLARIEQQLQDIQELEEENNELLIKMQRQARWAFWGKLILWLLVLGLPLIFLGPLLNAIFPYDTTSSGSFFGLPSPEQVRDIISTYQSAATTTR